MTGDRLVSKRQRDKRRTEPKERDVSGMAADRCDFHRHATNGVAASGAGPWISRSPCFRARPGRGRSGQVSLL